MNSDDVAKLRAMTLFLQSMNEDQAARFLLNQQNAIDGLHENHQAWVEACRVAWNEIEGLKSQVEDLKSKLQATYNRPQSAQEN